jgi:hypothetical protein
LGLRRGRLKWADILFPVAGMFRGRFVLYDVG